MTFDTAVRVSGTPALTLSIGREGFVVMHPIPRTAVYLRGDRSTKLVFGYTVTASDRVPAGGVSIPENALAVDGDPGLGLQRSATPKIERSSGVNPHARLRSAALADDLDHRVEGTVNRFADARLASLELDGLTLSPTFSLSGTTPLLSGPTSYTADAAFQQTATTALAEPFVEQATVAVTPDDSNPILDGHQVALAPGANTITVTVTSANGNETRDYTVTAMRAPPPKIAISANESSIGGGFEDLELTLTATANDTADGDQTITGSRAGTAFGTEQTVTIVSEETDRTWKTAAGSAAVGEVLLEADSLALNGAGASSGRDGAAAVLAHAGARSCRAWRRGGAL